MAYGLIAGLADVSDQHTQLTTAAEKAGSAIGTGLGVTLILILWAMGAVILGLLAVLTRGPRVMIECD